MNPLLRLLGAAASHGTGQLVFSTAFVGACELPNWLHAPRQVNACRSRSSARSVLPLRHAAGSPKRSAGPGPRTAGGVPMNRPIPSRDYVDHFDPELERHRAWLQAALERLVDHEPEALVEGGPLWRLWITETAPVATPPPPAEATIVASASRHPNPLEGIPRLQQRDCAQLSQRDRTCFSSSCAMLLEGLKPGTQPRDNGDDASWGVVQRS